MAKILIFCEGKSDQCFIGECLKFFFGKNILREKVKTGRSYLVKFDEGEIIDIDGFQNIYDPIHINRMKDNSELEGKNIIIFDADYPSSAESAGNGNMGFDSCKQKLEFFRTKKELNFDFYIWPNNTHNGSLENLIIKLIHPSKGKLMDCLQSQIECLRGVKSEIEILNIPEIKETINSYGYLLGQNTDPGVRDYCQNEIWNLNPSEINELESFIVFLKKFVSN